MVQFKMQTLILKTTRSQYGSPFDNDDYVVLHDDHVIGRIMLHPQAPEGPVVLDNHCYGLSAIDPHSRLFRDTRAGNGGFQSAVALALIVLLAALLRGIPDRNEGLPR